MDFYKNLYNFSTREKQSQFLFDCKGCPRRFRSKLELNEHLRQRIFVCPLRGCRQSFVHQHEYDFHRNRCNPDRLQAAASTDNYKIFQVKYVLV